MRRPRKRTLFSPFGAELLGAGKLRGRLTARSGNAMEKILNPLRT